MHTEEYLLGMNEEVRRLILSGDAERFGGVIRRTDNKRIIAWLKDADYEEENLLNQGELIGAIPVAIMGASFLAINKRLASIENEIKKLQTSIEIIETEIEFSNVKLDAILLGELRGTLFSCQLEINEGRKENLITYRQKFIESYNKLLSTVKGMASKQNLVKRHTVIFLEYAKAMILAGIAARDISIHAKQRDSALTFSKQFCEDIDSIQQKYEITLANPSSLFWQEDIHLDAFTAIKEYKNRLLSHDLALNTLPLDRINEINHATKK